MKVNDTGVALNGATFALDGAPASGTVATNGSSIVFVGDLYYGSTITLTETVYPVNYEKDTQTIAVITTSNAGTVTSSGASVSGPDADGRYTIRIQNSRNIETVVVSKTLDDLLAAGEESFSFLAVLSDENNQPIADYAVDGVETTDSNGEYSFDIQVANGSTADKTLYVPSGANLIVREILDGAQATDYVTTVDGAQGVEKSFTNVNATSTVTFKNTRKTSRVYVAKQLSDIYATSEQPFTFRATLETPAETPISLYNMEQGALTVSEDENVTDSNGQVEFVLNVLDGQNGEHYQVVPVGARLKVEEVLTLEQESAYSTTVKYNNETPESATVMQIASVLPDVNSTLLFANTRKTVTVTLTKRLLGSDAGTFAFTAEVLYNGVRSNYSLNNFTDGIRSFSLEKDASIELLIPMGSTLTLTEIMYGTETIESITVSPSVTDTDQAENILSFLASADTEIEWTNRILPAPTGVHMASEPYALILIAGMMLVMLLWLGKRKNKNKSE